MTRANIRYPIMVYGQDSWSSAHKQNPSSSGVDNFHRPRDAGNVHRCLSLRNTLVVVRTTFIVFRIRTILIVIRMFGQYSSSSGYGRHSQSFGCTDDTHLNPDVRTIFIVIRIRTTSILHRLHDKTRSPATAFNSPRFMGR